MFFESQHSINENEFHIFTKEHMNFTIHIHRSFEFFEQIQGSTEVLVGDKKYLLTSGEAVLIFPLQPHSYESRTDGQIRLCIFSPDMVADFYKTNGQKIPANSRFKSDIPANMSLDNHFHKKAFSYLICAEFENGREYLKDAEKSKDRLLTELLLFADKNYSGSCLLRDAASKIGYDYAYVSKYFKGKVGISFRQYVNDLRIIESKQLLKSGSESIEEIAEACGFCSLRTFDREFRNQTGMTPSEYRRTKTGIR